MSTDCDLTLGKGIFGDLLLTQNYSPLIRLFGQGVDLTSIGRVYSESDPGVNVYAYFDQMTVQEIDVGSVGGFGAKVVVNGVCYIGRINVRSERSDGGVVMLGDNIKCPDINVYGGEKPGFIQVGKNCELQKLSLSCGRDITKTADVILDVGSVIKS